MFSYDVQRTSFVKYIYAGKKYKSGCMI